MKLVVKNEGGREGGKAGEDGRVEKRKKIHGSACMRHCRTFFNPVGGRKREGAGKGVGFSLPTRPIQRRFL